MSDVSEQAVAYAALILADEGVELTDVKLETLLKAANVEYSPIWVKLFANAFEGQDVKALLTNIGSGAGAAGPAAAAGAAAGGAAAAPEAAPAKEEAKKEEEESDDDMGFGLFD